MKTRPLNRNWQFKKVDDSAFLPATVPGAVHLDLLANERLADPFFRDNEKEQYWVGETDWHYRTTFTLTPADLQHQRIALTCYGLDTLTTLTLNGVQVGAADNMYRTWTFDVKPVLREGENTLDVVFAAPMPYVRQADEVRGKLPTWSVGDHRLNAGSYLRKQPSNFGWDWGPQFVTSGIWRAIELQMFNAARINDVYIAQDHAVDQRVTLEVAVDIEYIAEDVTFVTEVTLTRGERQVLTQQFEPDQPMQVVISQPELWYPNGLGEQPLYAVCVRLVDAQGVTLDQWERRIGLRTLRLIRQPDAWGESFHFEINGRPFFAKGANWIPADPFVGRLTRADYEPLVADAAAVNMNMLRVWGGGVYEHDSFYDLCDEYGLCVWQDFMFACGTYPTYDTEFMANVRAEAVDNVRRLRHHAALALWCGNNEIEQGLVGNTWTDFTMSLADYSKLFDDLLGEVVKQHHPDGAYWPGSPHSPCGDRLNWENPACGDVHLWGVWHGNEPFEWYQTCLHRFVSEFGFQSFPQPSTLYPVLTAADHDIHGPVLAYRQRSQIGNGAIETYMADWFQTPKDFASFLWLSQILQGMAMKMAVEHWRRQMPRTMGTLYWQLNDIWQAPSWSSIEYGGGWKALQHMAQHFYAPTLISGVWQPETNCVEVYVTNDHSQEIAGELRWQLVNLHGQTLAEASEQYAAAGISSRNVTTPDLSQYVEAHGADHLLLWLELRAADTIVSSNTVLMARPRHLQLRQPNLSYEIRWLSEEQAQVTLHSQSLALWVWLACGDLSAKFSDNFFHLLPDQAKVIHAQVPAHDRDRFEQALHVSSLFDMV
ncbi:MAG: glycoside hydrolase family 2 protein [Chloroflexi bacterium]|nr:glycoside hydrolase family 2 protein [Chloroflexota bacterium]